jgi:methionyl-tRNA formyltransferase
VTYAAKLDKAEAPLDWRRSASELERQVRAFNPFPGATASLGGQPLKIWQARDEEGRAQPGEIVSAGRDGIVVGCGAGLLRLVEVQKAGGKRLSAADFLAGMPLAAGQSFVLLD